MQIINHNHIGRSFLRIFAVEFFVIAIIIAALILM